MTAPRPVPEPSDAALVSAWRGGDEAAAAELVRRHSGALARFLYGSGAPPGEIEDLVQETLIRAFRSIAGWRGEASFRSWIFRIGGNLAKDHFRKEGRRVLLSLTDHTLRDPADPAADAEAHDADQRLLTGMRELPRLQRAVFVLRAQQGLSYDEIAATLGTTPGAARVHYHHAVKRLKGLLS